MNPNIREVPQKKTKRKNLLGNTYNQLTVIDYAPSLPNYISCWLCRCICGNEIIIRQSSLLNGKTKTCGCRTTLKKSKDLTGRRFQKLVVLSYSHSNKRHSYWVCICDCGEGCVRSSRTLTISKVNNSCGCDKRRGNVKNLTGRIFNYLKVISYDKSIFIYGRNRVFWRCQCVCGSIVEVSTDQLRSGQTKSCGCIHSTPPINISGKSYGHLTALYPWNEKPGTLHTWLYLCDCGNVVIRAKHRVSNEGIESCGCTYLGPNHHQWKGGITKLSSQIRNLPRYTDWRESIFKRDNYTCQGCKTKGVYLNAHHIYHFSNILQDFNIEDVDSAKLCAILWDIDNGISLCFECHAREHEDVGLFRRKS